MTEQTYVRMSLPCTPYFYSHNARSGSVTYKGEFIVDKWYVRFDENKFCVAFIPVATFLKKGRVLLDLLWANDEDFKTFLYNLYCDGVKLSDEMQELNSNAVLTNTIVQPSTYNNKYYDVFSKLFVFGYALDFALNEVMTHVESKLPVTSFIAEEEYELSQIRGDSDKLQTHHAKWNWIQNGYAGSANLTVSDFARRADTLGDTSAVVHQKRLVKPQSKDEWIQLLIHLRDIRKKLNLVYFELQDNYLQSECQRLDINRDETLLYTSDEFEEIKTDFVPYSTDERIIEVDNYGFRDISLSEWDKIEADYNEQHELDVDSVTGRPAYAGIVRGPVKIVKHVSNGDFRDGDILITSMTRPEFVPLMKKAAGIVTDEGGVTCHAAILSRELKKPCVVSTKIATQVFKDGDMVEVDADAGVVRKIK